ncbi:neprilysin-2-like [Oppia nitens]|uniref:neprilysin-2-like n=1 Tax=Oppia nitens TaxID=1686743 RepID=UPI0023DC823B|nr:neprilysin-2-like [Oppia nitens]
MLTISGVLLTLILIINSSAHSLHKQSSDVCLTHDCIKEAARILRTIDETVSPCDDFYQFSCGKWIESTVIPEHKSSQSTFDELQDELNKKLRVLIEENHNNNNVINNDNKMPIVTKIKDLYYSCMNTSIIEKIGDKPLVDLLLKFGGWPVIEPTKWDENNFNWFDSYIKLRQYGLYDNVLMAIFVDIDDKNTSKRALYLDQLSVGLYDRDLLLKGLNDSSVLAYYELMVKSAVLLGADKTVAKKQMKEVLDFETQLANYSLPKEERRNMSLLYNKMTIDELTIIAPNTDWISLINNYTTSPVQSDEQIIVSDKNYIQSLDLLLPQTKKRILANYMMWRIVFSEIGSMGIKWRNLKTEYDARVLGKQRQEPRWEQCVNIVESTLGIGLSNLYVDTYFNNENKQMTLDIVKNIKIEFERILHEIDWMEKTTMNHAMDKLKQMELKIGYPDQLRDINNIIHHYKDLNFSRHNYFQNRINAYKWLNDFQFSQLKEINDKNDWRKYAEVTEVNAFYYPQENAMVIPAGILQGIFYNKNRPNYLNYGTIGEVAGHEITHGFDDTGRQFDSIGQVNNWWDSSTDQKFKTKCQCIIDQYANYTVESIGMQLNGINTQGENVADNGGIKQAFRAYKKYVERNGSEPLLPGLKYTPEQLFWISYGIQSCSKESLEHLKLMIEIDSHSPSKYRIIGVLSNLVDFAKSFNCPIGSAMNPINKCTVW